MARKPKKEGQEDSEFLTGEASLEEVAKQAERLSKKVAKSMEKEFESVGKKLETSLEKNLTPIEKAFKDFEQRQAESAAKKKETSTTERLLINLINNVGEGRKFDTSGTRVTEQLLNSVGNLLTSGLKTYVTKPVQQAIQEMEAAYEGNFTAIAGAMGTNRKDTHNLMKSAVSQLVQSNYSGAINANKELIPALNAAAQKGFQGQQAVQVALDNAVDSKIMPWLETNSDVWASIQYNLSRDSQMIIKAQSLALQETKAGNRLLNSGIINTILNDVAPTLTNIDYNTGGLGNLSVEAQAQVAAMVESTGMTTAEAYSEVKKAIDVLKNPAAAFDRGDAANVLMASEAYAGKDPTINSVLNAQRSLYEQAAAAGRNASFLYNNLGLSSRGGFATAEAAKESLRGMNEEDYKYYVGKLEAADVSLYVEAVDNAEEKVTATEQYDNEIKNAVTEMSYDTNLIPHGVDLLQDILEQLGSIAKILGAQLVTNVVSTGLDVYKTYKGYKARKSGGGGYDGDGGSTSKRPKAPDGDDGGGTARKHTDIDFDEDGNPRRLAEQMDDIETPRSKSPRTSSSSAGELLDNIDEAGSSGTKIVNVADDAGDGIHAFVNTVDDVPSTTMVKYADDVVEEGSGFFGKLVTKGGKTVAREAGEELIEQGVKTGAKTVGKQALKTAGKTASKLIPFAGDVAGIASSGMGVARSIQDGNVGAGIAYGVGAIANTVGLVADCVPGIGTAVSTAANVIGAGAEILGDILSFGKKVEEAEPPEPPPPAPINDYTDALNANALAVKAATAANIAEMEESVRVSHDAATQVLAITRKGVATEEELQQARKLAVDAGILSEAQARAMNIEELNNMTKAYIQSSEEIASATKNYLEAKAEENAQETDNEVDQILSDMGNVLSSKNTSKAEKESISRQLSSAVDTKNMSDEDKKMLEHLMEDGVLSGGDWKTFQGLAEKYGIDTNTLERLSLAYGTGIEIRDEERAERSTQLAQLVANVEAAAKKMQETSIDSDAFRSIAQEYDSAIQAVNDAKLEPKEFEGDVRDRLATAVATIKDENKLKGRKAVDYMAISNRNLDPMSNDMGYYGDHGLQALRDQFKSDLSREEDPLKAEASYAVGTPWVPSDMIAQLHEGEAVIPASSNIARLRNIFGTSASQMRKAELSTKEIVDAIVSQTDVTNKTLKEILSALKPTHPGMTLPSGSAANPALVGMMPSIANHKPTYSI